MSVIDRAFLLYQQGYSLRKLSSIFKIPFTTLGYKFRNLYGKDYIKTKNKNGILPIIKEYLRNPDVSDRDKRVIREWMNLNLRNIIKNDLTHSNIPLFTDAKIEKLTKQEFIQRERFKYYLTDYEYDKQY
ncbi:hypothetical protein ACQFX9_14335 [Aliinostoc sp. HNIBRCY26]|uniref:hypothetical protein n=1 Tax=Aliinostoc sp. HNIBRCY26 TaxID=3418997 RepID=UPI003D02F1A3